MTRKQRERLENLIQEYGRLCFGEADQYTQDRKEEFYLFNPSLRDQEDKETQNKEEEISELLDEITNTYLCVPHPRFSIGQRVRFAGENILIYLIHDSFFLINIPDTSNRPVEWRYKLQQTEDDGITGRVRRISDCDEPMPYLEFVSISESLLEPVQ